MRYSYSNVSTFSQCPYKWKLNYIDHLKTIPETNVDNPLWLGLAIHKGLETGSVEAALEEYKSHYNIITDENINWMLQIEYQLPRVMALLPPGGEHELEVRTSDFVGFIDYVCGDTLFDYKFSNNIENYTKSPQLSIYKNYLESVRPDIQINHLKYVFIPKVQIRQKLKSKPPETLNEFRDRLIEHLKTTEVKLVEVPYSPSSVTDFKECCKIISQCEEFPKKKSRLCDFCSFKKYCESDGKEDWMIL